MQEFLYVAVYVQLICGSFCNNICLEIMLQHMFEIKLRHKCAMHVWTANKVMDLRKVLQPEKHILKLFPTRRMSITDVMDAKIYQLVSKL